VFELSKVTLPHVKARMLSNLVNVDETLAARVADGLGEKAPQKSKAAVEPIEMKASPGLRLIDKYPPSLKGRSVGILVTDGADASMIDMVKKAAEGEGATVKIVAQKVGGVTTADGKALVADGQLAGMPSVIFDAVALVVSKDGCQKLLTDSAALDFVTNAFVHLKAIGHTAEAQPLLDRCGVEPDAGIAKLGGKVSAFIEPAKTRQWAREPKVRVLA
jgi:catalase